MTTATTALAPAALRAQDSDWTRLPVVQVSSRTSTRICWALVGIPLLWGIWTTLAKSAVLFR